MTRKLIPVLMTILIWGVLALFPAAPARANGMVTQCSDDTDFSNQLSGGGTITFNCGTATIVLSSTKTITTNTTIDGGGTIALSGDNARRLFIVNPGARLELRNIVIENGFSKGGGGGAILNLDTLSIANSQFLSNTVTNDWSGGAIYSNNHLAISDSRFSYNQGGSAGAIYEQSSVSQMNIWNTTFDHNQATHITLGSGGALLLTDNANATVISSTLSQNQARIGGAVAVRSGSRLTINGGTIRDNSAGAGGDAAGGGIDNDASTVILTDATLSGNFAGEGGGIHTFGGALTLNRVTFSGNSAVYGAGANIDLGTHTLTNVTFSGNTSHSGGGIYNSRATLTLLNVTLAHNSSDTGLTSGIVNVGGGPDPQLNLKNVLLAAGVVGANCTFDIAPASSDFNLSDDNSCNFGAARDGVDLLLGPLANNGGPTLTQIPFPPSKAIDGGSGCPATDQRGVARPQGAACDVGAVEYVPGELSPWLYLPLILR